MIPLRKCLESIEVQVDYEPLTKTITARNDETTLINVVGENTLNVNGKNIRMDTASIVKDGRTYVPVRFIYEAFERKVTWHPSSRTVIVE